jgi:hypothetical protein
MNGIGQLQDEIKYRVSYDKQGMVTVTKYRKLKSTLWERMELKDFPMDIQALSILITTHHPYREMAFVKNLSKPSGLDRRVFTDEQEWYLFEHIDIEVTEEIDFQFY